VRKFRKKPVVIEAVQWDGTPASSQAVVNFAGGAITWWFNHNTMQCDTLEGPLAVSVGDWIIRGVKGEFYPCKPDIFAATYEPVESVAREEP